MDKTTVICGSFIFRIHILGIFIMAKELVQAKDEVIKNRVFGMPLTKMTRHQRVSFTAMIKIAYDALSINKDVITFTYSTNDFFKMIGITEERKQAHLFSNMDEWGRTSGDYSLEETLKKLINKSINFKHKDSNTGEYQVEGIALISYFKLTKDEITFRFDEWVREKIPAVNNLYIMKMPIISSFKSGYSVTLFEQIEQRRDFRKWQVSVEALRLIFGIDEKKYVKFSDFRKRIIEVSIKEINTNSKYSLAVEYIKKGRSIDKVIFTWYINKTSLEEFKSFIRKHFIDTALVDSFIGEDKSAKHLVSVSKDGKLYNKKSTHSYSTEDAKRIWKWLYDNQDKLLIKEQAENIEDFNEDNFGKYYGKDLIFDEEMFNNIIYIQPTSKKNKLKIKFYSGEILIMSEEDFMSSVII